MQKENTLEIEWEKFLKGDRSSFEKIYNSNFKSLFLYALRFSKDDDLIKDVIQNVFINFWEKRNYIKEVKNVTVYLHRSVRNELLNRKRQEDKYAFDVLDEQVYAFDFELPLEARIIKKEELKETRQRLKHALENITDRQKEILYLKYVKGMTFEEISDTIGITVKASYKLHARAISSIRQNFGNNRYSIAFLISLYFS
ncbi:RNA polymerase sigma factor [Sphingobacterium detergens]|uniref:RNA polymerase sigma factor (Sigma-70 family) n=1 Tax=Sphingobacterium detergens TaxID=1145106 RepID=A0A420BKS2_SPHD1|nr:sigma-70 family RNA polymerase sigma factor [Sphingobacterium detergens]RKE57319.1 RNA polymerase sigma factor (sigma-70 family) [Sphingobacterium detergens]